VSRITICRRIKDSCHGFIVENALGIDDKPETGKTAGSGDYFRR